MNGEILRIKELESQLEQVAKYLNSLPKHPMTYQVLNETLDVLNKSHMPNEMSGGKFHPSGHLLVAAKVSSDSVIVKTQHIPKQYSEETRKRIVDRIYKSLLKGMTIPLRKFNENDPILSRSFFTVPTYNLEEELKESHRR